MLTHRKAYVVGALCGLAVAGAAAVMVGMGEQPGMGDLRLTSSSDGRTVYVWSLRGGKIEFVESARAPKGHGEEEEHGKAEDRDKGGPDDKGKKDEDEKSKGKGKGRG